MSTQTAMPIPGIKKSKSIVANTNGEPTLITSTTSNYTWIWSDVGSGSDKDCTVFRPAPTVTGFYIVGDYAQGNYSGPSGTSLIVMAVNEDPHNPLLSKPSDYVQVWNDKGSHGDHDGAIWRPVAPDGYLALGCVANGGYGKPDIDNYRCVRKDLVTDSLAGNLIWSDKGSHADEDVSLYQLTDVGGAFVAQGNYDPYVGPAYKLVNN